MAVDRDTPERTSGTDPGDDASTTTAPERSAGSTGLDQTLTRSESGDSDPGSLEGLAPEQRGRYRRAAELGRGGQSVVTQALDLQLGREVAIKELRPGSPPAAAARFLREARITARLEHPNIVPVYEIGRRDDGTLYCVQKLIRAPGPGDQPMTLRRALDEARTLTARLALLPHVVAVCNGVAYAHAQGVLHRDLKPENVVLGRFGETIILDWGLARAGDDVTRPQEAPSGAPLATIAGVAYGTPSYMSPEQARGETLTLDARTDVFSLGALLFELLVGRPPYVGGTAQEIVQQVLERPVPDAQALSPQAPPELCAIAMRALQRDRHARFASAQAMAEEVLAWQNGRRVSVYSYTLFELVRLFVTRYRLVSLVAVAAFVLVGAAGVFAWSRYTHARLALSTALVERARQADRELRWDLAAVLYAAARVQDDNPITRWGTRISSARLHPRPTPLAVQAAGARAIAFSPDGALIATAGFGGQLRVFRADTGALEVTLGRDGREDLTSVTWSPDGQRLATTGEDGRLVLWNRGSWTEAATLAREGHGLNAFAWSPDGALGVAVAEAGAFMLFDLRSLTELRRESVSPHPAYAVAWHPGGEFFTVVNWSGEQRVFDRAGEPVLVEKASSGLRAVAYSPNGLLLATAGIDRDVRVYAVDGTDGGLPQPGGGYAQRLVATLEGHGQKVMSLAFSPAGDLLASASTDRTLRLWQPTSARRPGESFYRHTVVPLVTASAGGQSHALGVSFSPDGGHYAVARAGAPAELYRTPSPQTLLPETARREALASMHGQDLVAVGHRNMHLLSGPRLEHDRVFEGYGGGAMSVQFSRSGRHLAWPCVEDGPEDQDGGVRWTSRVCWVALAEPERLHAVPFHIPVRLPGFDGSNLGSAAAVSPDGRWLLATDRSGVVRRWSLPDEAPRGRIEGHTNAIYDLDFNPAGTLLATASYDKTIRLWNPETAEVLRVLEGHNHGVRRARFSPDGKTLASVSWDTTLRLWDAETGAALRTCRGHEEHVAGVDWAPDGTWVLTGARDGTIRLWDPRDCTALAQFYVGESVYAAVVVGAGDSIVFQGLGVHRFDFDPLRDPVEHLADLERRTGLRVVGADVLPAE